MLYGKHQTRVNEVFQFLYKGTGLTNITDPARVGAKLCEPKCSEPSVHKRWDVCVWGGWTGVGRQARAAVRITHAQVPWAGPSS